MRKTIQSIRAFFAADHVKAAEEAYLNGSLDRVDLEYRQRQVDRGMFRKPRHGGYGLV